jgi:pimeloyl-ACP methyl ester carboxylesterase
MRGTGGSEPAEDPHRYGLKAAALDLLEILQACGPAGKKRVILIGHDLGSVHAWYLAPLLSDRLKGLVIVNGAHLRQMWLRFSHLRQLFKSWYIVLLVLPVVPEVLMHRLGHYLIHFIYLFGGMPADLAEAHVNGFTFMPETVKQYREFAKMLPEVIRGREVSRLKVPLLSLSSASDPFVEPAHLDELEELAEHSIARVLPGRHWIQCEDPERVNRLLEQFFRQECGA